MFGSRTSDHCLAASSKLEFEAIRKTKVYEEVARQIQHKVLHEMAPGDLLPSELELAQTFGVSRGSVRDAIHSLELIGLLDRLPGKGTVVRKVSAESSADPIAAALTQQRHRVEELLDVRKIIEPALANRAALRITAEEVAELERILERQQEKVSRHELAIEEDCQFHYNIAMAAENGVMLRILDILMDLLRETREKSLQTEGRLEKSFACHRRIVAALKEHDGPAAEAAMREHLHQIEIIVRNRF